MQAEFLQFLYELSQNNHRDWFEKNKTRYEQAVKKPFEGLVADLIHRLEAFDPGFRLTPKDCIFRLHRDTRFSNDKTPYKTHIAAVFSKGGRQNLAYPGYYMQIEYGSVSIGGGAYWLEKEPLRLVRTAIAQDPDTFRAILSEPAFVQAYGEIKGEKNKVLPSEFREAAKTEPLLFHKQFYYMTELAPESALQNDFPDMLEQYMRAAQPFNAYLRQALTLD